ncbi:MAG: efflux RND transporter periplasmic adaptor subunit [Deltaproteobacteria bacterium]|nr:efflux RND transporter periplasmic adaptor subunit [Deltaproteobacteria bacterium]MBT8465896.1 efflux RND transporter periplasmic adaptor subunit [Deltaproteobacteria bacterium]NNK06597.1 efflux RND transporter periplasmic adaptor subunit [Myxococcales bacterium]NNK41836.1 efflux RND transporter periplasmic adaptor subunit [Myxococcales bacterium]
MTKRSERRLKWALSIGVLLAAFAVAYVLVITKAEPPRAEKPLEGTLVDVIQIEASRHEVDLHAKGTVVPAQEIVLQPELGGRVIWQSPELVAGGRFKAGQPIVRIDPRDYQLAAESFRSQVNRAKLELRLEKRRGEVAVREWNSFGEMDVSEEQRALAQRKPQLESTRLELKAAQSALKKAQLDLTRTTLRAPFNAMVVSESVDTGQLLSPQTTVARLVGTDEYHVQVSVPVAALRTVRARTNDAPGSETKISQRVGQETIERRGEVIRQLPDLDPGGAMARILVRIENPLGQAGDLPLLLGSFVDVEVGAQPIDDAIRVPRVALRNGRNVFVMNDLDQLEIREVQIAWSEPDAVLVTGGLQANERVVISRIPTPVPNMLLRTLTGKPEAAPSDPSEPAAQATP